jgi:hypothetical protein
VAGTSGSTAVGKLFFSAEKLQTAQKVLKIHHFAHAVHLCVAYANLVHVNCLRVASWID